MNKNIEKIDGYLKGVALPEHVSEQHRRKLRRQILNKIERRQTMFVRKRAWKVAAVLAIVIGAGALATTVGLKVRKLYFVGRESDGAYRFATRPQTVDEPMRMVISRLDPNQTVEQKIKDLEEVELLRQQDKRRELLSVFETEVNGKLQSRSFKFKYLLADGREITLNERDPDTKDLEKSLTEAQKEEVLNLMREMKYEDLDKKEKEVMGRVFVFGGMKFILSDGTEVIKSFSMSKDDQ